jgi:aldehyde:ferredoxin oxidoreductase
VAVSEVGPDHTRWYPPHPGHPGLLKNEDLARLGVQLDLSKAAQGRNPEEKGKVLRWFTISRAIVESLPSCVFLIRDTLGFDLHPWHDLFQTVTGIQVDYSEFIRAGERVMNLDRAFLVREGFRRADDRPPLRMATEDVPEFGYPKLDGSIFDRMLDDYYQANGWSLNTSIPRRNKLDELGLGDVAQELEKRGMEVEP